MPAFTMAHKAAALYVCVYNRYYKIEMHIILINRQSQSRSGRQTIYDCFGHNFLSSGIAFHANQITEYNKKKHTKTKAEVEDERNICVDEVDKIHMQFLHAYIALKHGVDEQHNIM